MRALGGGGGSYERGTPVRREISLNHDAPLRISQVYRYVIIINTSCPHEAERRDTPSSSRVESLVLSVESFSLALNRGYV